MPKLIAALAAALLLAPPILAQRGGAGTHSPSDAVRFVVQGKTEAAAQDAVAEMEAAMRRELRTSNIEAGEFSTADGELSFLVRNSAQVAAAIEVARRQSAAAASSGKFARLMQADDWDVRVSGPSRVFMRPTRALLDAAADSAMITVRDVIARRLVTLGALVDQVKRTDTQNILVEIRGLTDLAQVQAVIARPARLRLSLVDLTVLPEQLASGRAPVGSQILLTPQGERVAVARRVLIDNERVGDAYRINDKQSGRPAVEVRLDDLGTRRLAAFTSANLGRSFAVILDDVVLARQVIDQPISGGIIRISGNFEPGDATTFAVSLRSGPLPIDVKIVEQRSGLKR